jgi:hypothetical protein
MQNLSTLVPKQHLQTSVFWRIDVERQRLKALPLVDAVYKLSFDRYWVGVSVIGIYVCHWGNDLDNTYHSCASTLVLWQIRPLETVEGGTWLSI